MTHPRATPDSTVSTLLSLRKMGFSPRIIALELNRRGIPTARGKRWCVSSVRHVLRRYQES